MLRRSSPDRVVIGLLVLATVSLLTLYYRAPFVSSVRDGAGEVFGVFQAGARTVVRPVAGVVGFFGGIGEARERAERLERENAALKFQMQSAEQTAREAERLRRLLQIQSTLVELPIGARVVGTDVSGFAKTVRIDKGTDDGIAVGSAVLGPDGLIGRVAQTDDKQAVVVLVTDARSSIGVRVDTTGEMALVNGTGGARLRMELVDQQNIVERTLRRGLRVVTSGVDGGLFPPGLPVGVIDEVSYSDRGGAYTIWVRPLAKFSRLDWVSVATPGEPGAAPTPSPEAEASPDAQS